jgi:hypothetical protein
MPEGKARHAGCRWYPIRFRQRYPDVFETIAVAGRLEPLAWLTDVLGRLLPWNWKPERLAAAVSA